MYEFQSTLFRTKSQMSDAIAVASLSGGGWNSFAVQCEFLAKLTDIELADETIKEWGLIGEWAEKRDFTREDLIAAFSRVRHSINKEG